MLLIKQLSKRLQMKKNISIVIPVCNEEANVGVITAALKNIFDTLPYNYSINFVDDGSTDGTLTELKKIASIHTGQIILSSTSFRYIGDENDNEWIPTNLINEDLMYLG